MATYLVPGSYATIDLAIAAAVTGSDQAGIIEVAAGTYAFGINFTQWAGGRTAPLTVRAADPDNKPILDGTGLGDIGQAVRASSANVLGAVNRPTVQNIKFANWTAQTNGMVYNANGPTMVIEDCEFTDCGGVGLNFLRGPDAGDRSYVRRCKFLRQDGVVIKTTNSEYVSVSNCAMADCTGQAMSSSGGNSGFYDNSIWINDNGIVSVINCGTATGNVVQIAAGKSATRAFSSTAYDYNVTYGTFSGSNTGSDGGHNTTGDPGFTDAANGDLRWTPGLSACQGAGTAIAGITTDYFGTARPQGGTEDAGYYEAIVTTTVTGITVLSDTSIRLDLATSVNSDATWADTANYTITPSGGAAAVTITSATASGNPGNSITLVTSEHTDGATYNVEWSGLSNITDGDDDYVATGTAPEISSATLTGPKTLRVVWSEAMANNAALTTAGNYVIAPSTPVASVARINATTVDLTLGQRLPAASGTVTANGPQDLALNPAVDAVGSFSSTYLTFTTGSTSNSGRTVVANFNLAPTSGASDPDGWTVTPIGPGATVQVTAVDLAGTQARLTVWPPVSSGSTISVECPTAANGSGVIG